MVDWVDLVICVQHKIDFYKIVRNEQPLAFKLFELVIFYVEGAFCLYARCTSISLKIEIMKCKILSCTFFLVIMASLISSCSKSEEGTEIPVMEEQIDEEPISEEPVDESGELTLFQRNTISYFIDIALGFEVGNASKITRKWVSEMKIYVRGNTTDELQSELDDIVQEINSLITDEIKLEIVDTKEASNYEIFFGSYVEYGELYPNLAERAERSWGIFTLDINDDDQIVGGLMYVDTERANEAEGKHLLREELTQSLGLAQDSSQYEDSIFQIEWTTVTEYSELDRELIRLLYHPDMQIGLDKWQVDDVLKEILLKE